uniref:tetratricopeptide repeat protein n=1 Tax=Cephaloticoccus sp. TaxID=1985742 RepID=UPI004049A98A
MPITRRKTIAFDPKDPAWRNKLWVRLKTTEGAKLFIIWPRVWKLSAILLFISWLSLAGAGWAFIKYKRGINEASFIDIAFLPFRYGHYRLTLSTHYQTLAQKQLEAGKWNEALVSLRLAVGNNAKNHEARRQLADIYRQLQRPDFALKLLKKGLERGADDIAYLRDLFRLLDTSNQQNQIISLGTRLLNTLPEDTPEHRETVLQMVQAQIRMKDPTAAKGLLEHWHLTDSIDGQLQMAEIEKLSGYPRLAILRLEGLMRNNPRNEMIGLRLVSLYTENGQLAEARQLAIQRTLRRPESPGALVDLINLYHASGDQAAYQETADKFVAKFSQDLRALMLLSTSAIRLKEPELARQVRDAASRDENGWAPVILQVNLMQAQCSAGDYAAALVSADIVDGYKSTSPMIQGITSALRVWASYALGKTNDGETWLNQLLTLTTPSLNQNGPMLAFQLDQLGRKPESRRVLLTLVERNPDSSAYLVALVKYDLELQSWDEVKKRLPDLLALDPTPVELLGTIWSLQDVLNLNPELRQRLNNLLN